MLYPDYRPAGCFDLVTIPPATGDFSKRPGNNKYTIMK